MTNRSFHTSHGPDDRQEHGTLDNQAYRYSEVARKSHRSHWGWWFVGILVVAAIVVLAAVWMSGTSSELHHAVSGMERNSQALAQQQSELSGLKQQLTDLQNSIQQLGDSIRQMFAVAMEHFHN